MYLYTRVYVLENELVTPPLDSGIILPGVVRKSSLEIARGWGDIKVSERQIDMNDIVQAQEQGRVRCSHPPLASLLNKYQYTVNEESRAYSTDVWINYSPGHT